MQVLEVHQHIKKDNEPSRYNKVIDTRISQRPYSRVSESKSQGPSQVTSPKMETKTISNKEAQEEEMVRTSYRADASHQGSIFKPTLFKKQEPAPQPIEETVEENIQEETPADVRLSTQVPAEGEDYQPNFGAQRRRRS